MSGRRAGCWLVVAAVLGWASPGAAADTAVVGHVVRTVGFVTLVRDDSTRVVPEGAEVRAADRIVTAADGRVEIAGRDGTVLVIGPASEIVVAEYAVDVRGLRLRAVLSLLGGVLRATVAAAADGAGFDVETRVAVASVRATDWVVESETPDRAAVFVVEGAVEVTARAVPPAAPASVRLEAGFGTDVVAGQPPTPPKAWGRARIEAVLAKTRL
ncbi:MAG: FecR domain-containing protein, partial [Rhodospirillales bacterium]